MIVSKKTLAGLFLLAVFGLGAAPARSEPVRISLNGVALNGNFVLAKGRTSADGVMLMVHGTLAHHAMDTIKGLQNTLTGHGISTLAITLSLGLDNRHGMYDCAKPHRHRHTDAFGEITAWLQWLAAKGVRDVTLMGHSRGGNVAAWYIVEHPNTLVKRLVLLAPGTWDAARSARNFEMAHKRPLGPVLAEAQKLVAAGKGDTMMKGVGLLYCPGADVTAASFVSYYGPDTRRDTPTLLPKIGVPVLVVAGGQDTVVRGLPERVRPLADGKRLHLAVIEDATHFFLDLFAEDVADAVEAMMEKAR